MIELSCVGAHPYVLGNDQARLYTWQGVITHLVFSLRANSRPLSIDIVVLRWYPFCPLRTKRVIRTRLYCELATK
jgi:hypothetical protein